MSEKIIRYQNLTKSFGIVYGTFFYQCFLPEGKFLIKVCLNGNLQPADFLIGLFFTCPEYLKGKLNSSYLPTNILYGGQFVAIAYNMWRYVKNIGI